MPTVKGTPESPADLYVHTKGINFSLTLGACSQSVFLTTAILFAL